ncbi:MAG: cation diffusion facilitator family transporter [Helicobacteraceae bacterium]|nr:cation diffusion facilitator family transporter [Helicobacteraceae bacterium]
MKKNSVLFVVILNSLIVAFELFFGVISGSMALITDAAHNLGDVAAVIVTFIAIIYGAKAASEKFTFGFVRSEMMAAFVNALFLCVTMIYISYEAIGRVFNPIAIEAKYVIVVAFIALIANGISAFILKKAGVAHSHRHAGDCDHVHEDLNVKSAYLHMLSDALISLGVIVGGIAILLFEIVWLDSVLALAFSAWIFFESYKVLKASFFSLMDYNKESLKTYEDALKKFEIVKSVHDIHLFAPSSAEKHFSAHIVLAGNPTLSDVEKLLEEIRRDIARLGVTHSLIQSETAKYAQDDILCAAHCRV